MGPSHADGSIPDIILFDGVCVLCSRMYRFVSVRDRSRRFHFLPVQSPEGRELANRYGIDPDNPDTFAVIDATGAHLRSDGALRVLRSLPGWSWTRVLALVPRATRDRVYDLVARNRYRWFGRLEACMLPQGNVTLRRDERT